MRLFLIRHGETVDNVAQVWAGVRDSELTNHGFQQATRLGLHLHANGVKLTHVFSSHLQRAWKTAESIVVGQRLPRNGVDVFRLQVIRLPLLMEQDFGSREGKPHTVRNGGLLTEEDLRALPDFKDMESEQSMAARIDVFLEGHLLPLFRSDVQGAAHTVAIVSHGIILSVLWRRLLLRLSPRSVEFTPETPTSLEHLGRWSNTGYLELDIRYQGAPEPPLGLKSCGNGEQSTVTSLLCSTGKEDEDEIQIRDLLGNETGGTPKPASPSGTEELLLKGAGAAGGNLRSPVAAEGILAKSSPTIKSMLDGWKTTVRTINSREHLKGLKRTGGGVGSSRHDASQKTLETFFKRRKV